MNNYPDNKSKKMPVSAAMSDLQRVWKIADTIKLSQRSLVGLAYKDLLKIAYIPQSIKPVRS